jgi:hypothetical protein
MKQVRGVVAEVQSSGEAFVRQSDLQTRMDRMESEIQQRLNEILQSRNSVTRSNYQAVYSVPTSQTTEHSSKTDTSRWKDSRNK